MILIMIEMKHYAKLVKCNLCIPGSADGRKMLLFANGNSAIVQVLHLCHIHCVAKVYAVLPFYDVKCQCSGRRE